MSKAKRGEHGHFASGGAVDADEAEEKKSQLKKGGKVMGKACGGRADKRARGGRMSPSSPLSGAGSTSGGHESEGAG